MFCDLINNYVKERKTTRVQIKRFYSNNLISDFGSTTKFVSSFKFDVVNIDNDE